MTTLRTLKTLVLGETWVLPAGVAVVMTIAGALRLAAPELWSGTGGAILLAGVLAVLWTSVARTARGGRRPQP